MHINELLYLYHDSSSSGLFITLFHLLTQAIELEKNHVFYSNRSGAYASLKDYSNALSDAEECVRLSSTWAKGYSRKGAALYGLGRLPEAKAAYEAGLKIDPNNDSIKDALRDVVQEMRTPPSNPLAGLFGADMWTKLQSNPTTREYLKDPTYVERMKKLQSGQMNDPSILSDKRVSESLGVLLGVNPGAFSGRTPQGPGGAKWPGEDEEDEEEEVVVPATTSHPTMPKVEEPAVQPAAAQEEEEVVDEELEREKRERADRRKAADEEKQKGTAAYTKRDFTTAITHYKKAFEIDGTNAVYLNNLAAVYFEQADYKQCVETCKEAVQVTKTNRTEPSVLAKIYLRLANAYSKLQQWEDAIANYKFSILEDNVQTTRNLLKNAEAAKKKADEEAYLDPVKSEEAKEKGNLEFKEGRYPQAIEFYTEALKRDPNNYKVYSNRAACYTKLMQWDKGLEDCNKCLAKDPNFVKAYIRKGKIQHFLKQYPQALETFRKGMEIDPSCSELIEALQATRMAINESNRSGEVDQQRVQESMKDPAIQAILRDPMMNQVLQDLKDNPDSARRALSDPEIMAKIDKLVAAGIIRFG